MAVKTAASEIDRATRSFWLISVKARVQPIYDPIDFLSDSRKARWVTLEVVLGKCPQPIPKCRLVQLPLPPRRIRWWKQSVCELLHIAAARDRDLGYLLFILRVCETLVSIRRVPPCLAGERPLLSPLSGAHAGAVDASDYGDDGAGTPAALE